MSTFSKIIEGLAMLDPEFARDKREDKRMERQAELTNLRDAKQNDLALARDKYLASLQEVRDAKLHGNAKDLQLAQINADRTLAEFNAAQAALRQDRALAHSTFERQEGEKAMLRRDKQQSGYRREEMREAGDAAVSQADRMARNATWRKRGELMSLMPQDADPAENLANVREFQKLMSIDAPMAEGKFIMKHPEMKYGSFWRTDPRFNKDYDAERGTEESVPGKLNMNINDLMRGGTNIMDTPNPLTQQGGRALLRSIAPSLYD